MRASLSLLRHKKTTYYIDTWCSHTLIAKEPRVSHSEHSAHPIPPSRPNVNTFHIHVPPSPPIRAPLDRPTHQWGGSLALCTVRHSTQSYAAADSRFRRQRLTPCLLPRKRCHEPGRPRASRPSQARSLACPQGPLRPRACVGQQLRTWSEACASPADPLRLAPPLADSSREQGRLAHSLSNSRCSAPWGMQRHHQRQLIASVHWLLELSGRQSEPMDRGSRTKEPETSR